MKAAHAAAGAIALFLIGVFQSATILVELFGDDAHIRTVKTAILWGLLVLVPVIAAAGGSGTFLGLGRVGKRLEAKRKRMQIIALIGVLVLTPAALFLADRAANGALDALFYTVQALELVAGGVNFVLLGLNMRDGLAIRGRRAHSPSFTP